MSDAMEVGRLERLEHVVETGESALWDSVTPPGGYVCLVCGVPVESEPCERHDWAWKVKQAQAEVDDLRSRLACIQEACSWDRPYETRIEAIRGMCDLSQNGFTPVAESDSPQPDPAADPLADAIAREAEAAFVTHYVVVAATVDQDGNSGTHMIPSPGLPLWMQHGLLAYEAAATVPQPFYDKPDDDGGDER